MTLNVEFFVKCSIILSCMSNLILAFIVYNWFSLIWNVNEMFCYNHCVSKHAICIHFLVLSWSRSYGSWIYNYLCNQCLPLLKLWVRISLRRVVIDITLCDNVCQWLAAGRLFFRVLRFSPPVNLTAKI
jgi:hypothetical protein